MSAFLAILEAIGNLAELADVLLKWRLWVLFTSGILFGLWLFSSNAPEIAKTPGAVLAALTGLMLGLIWDARSRQR